MDYKDFDGERIKGKPLWTNCGDAGAILRDRFGFKLNEHPVVIIEYENNVFFLKSQTARGSNLQKNKLASKYANELGKNYNGVIVRQTEAFNPGLDPRDCLFSGDSLIDTTQVFVMDKTEFLECVSFDEESLYITRNINVDDRVKILKNLMLNLSKDQLSITEVKIDKSQTLITTTESKLLFCPQKLLERDLASLKKRNNDPYDRFKISNSELQKLEEFVNKYEHTKSNSATSVFSQILREEIIKTDYQKDDFYFALDLDDYLLLAKNFNRLGVRLNYTNEQLEDIQDEDISSLKARASFSDFERDYYKMHPDLEQERYPVRYYELKDVYEDVKGAKENNEELPELDEDIFIVDKDYEYTR